MKAQTRITNTTVTHQTDLHHAAQKRLGPRSVTRRKATESGESTSYRREERETEYGFKVAEEKAQRCTTYVNISIVSYCAHSSQKTDTLQKQPAIQSATAKNLDTSPAPSPSEKSADTKNLQISSYGNYLSHVSYACPHFYTKYPSSIFSNGANRSVKSQWT